MASNNDSLKKTFLVTISLCLFCSILVSAAAVFLKPEQEKNKILDMKKNILEAASLYKEGADIEQLFKEVKPIIIDIEEGTIADKIDPNIFDQYKVTDKGMIEVITPSKDLAGIKTRAKYAKIYAVYADGALDQLILPIHGKGLWSTMYGFMAVDKDTTSIKGFSYYAHGETPGLGGEVDNPNWKKQWKTKKIYSEDGILQIRLIKGAVASDSPNADYEVDGLSGSTLTSRGVTNMLTYWLGSEGFKKFLTKFKNGEVVL